MKYTVILPDCNSKTLTLESHEKSGRDLLQRVYDFLGLQECTKFFGLRYRDSEDGEVNWLAENDDLSTTLSKVRRLQFGVHFYPRHPENELLDEKALELFCLLLKEQLLYGNLVCSVSSHAYLDGLLAQARLGDFRPSKHKCGYLKQVKGVEICAPTVLNADKDAKESDYIREVGLNHRRNLGILSTEAYLRFVERVKELPYYGISVHRAKAKKEGQVFLGLSEKGLSVIKDKVIDRSELPSNLDFFHWSALRYCERSRGRLMLGFETGADGLKELAYKVKVKNSFCGAERLRKDIFGYRDVFAKEGSDFYRSKRKARKGGVVISSPPRRGAIPFVRLNSISDTLRRSFKVKKNLKARMKRGSEGDVTSDCRFSAANEIDRSGHQGGDVTQFVDVTQTTLS